MNNDKKKIGLALSGGGYRAAAYHVGTLRALHKLGILNKVDVISSVSGGSITTAYYALHKDDYVSRRLRIGPCSFSHLEELVCGLTNKQTHLKTLR